MSAAPRDRCLSVRIWVNEQALLLGTPSRAPQSAYHVLDKTAHVMWIDIDEGADIGPGLCIGHPGLPIGR